MKTNIKNHSLNIVLFACLVLFTPPTSFGESSKEDMLRCTDLLKDNEISSSMKMPKAALALTMMGFEQVQGGVVKEHLSEK